MSTQALAAARYMKQYNWLRDGVAEEQAAAVIDREIGPLLADSARMDVLESEYAHEQKRIAEGKDPGVSLFRMNQPITREAIDARR